MHTTSKRDSLGRLMILKGKDGDPFANVSTGSTPFASGYATLCTPGEFKGNCGSSRRPCFGADGTRVR